MQIKPILLVVDMQNGFCGLRGSFDKFGFNIKPEPFKWAVPFIPTISAMLKCEIHDLPLRGASGETVGSGKSSRLS